MTWAGRLIIVSFPKNISCNVIKAASVLCHSILDSFSAQKNYPCYSYIVYNLLCIKYRNKEVLRYDQLTYLGVKIDIDGGRQSMTIPATPPVSGQVGSGFVRFNMPR